MNHSPSKLNAAPEPAGSAHAIRKSEPIECIVIGGSAGGIEALLKILPALPPQFPLPILVVVHLPPEGRSLLPEIFGPRCHLAVKEAEDKEPIRGGVVYFAAPNYHLLIEADRTVAISSDEPVLYSRPSIDVLFESAADVFGSGLLAIVLTGANNDGAAGAKTVSASGGQVWVQHPEQAEASMMPKSVLDACPEARPLALADMAHEIQTAAGSR